MGELQRVRRDGDILKGRLPHLPAYRHNTKEGQMWSGVFGRFMENTTPNSPEQRERGRERGRNSSPRCFSQWPKKYMVNSVVLCNICGEATYVKIHGKIPQEISK